MISIRVLLRSLAVTIEHSGSSYCHITPASQPTTEPVKLPQRLVEVYKLLASLASQRRAVALSESPVPPEPAD